MVTRQLDWHSVTKKILLHILFWILILTYFAWGFGFENPIKRYIHVSFYLPGSFIMVYSLLYFLIPRYLLQRKFLTFFAGLIIVIGLCMLYTTIAQTYINNSENFRGIQITHGHKIIAYLHVGGIALSIKLLSYWYQQKKLTIEVERQKTTAELKLLKAQLHPHFLFNTLNNLYSLTLEASPKSPEIVMKLSELLRFIIYESNTPKIPLTKEINLLESYIKLEELRYGDRLDMSVKITGDVGKYQIAPFLLLPFLENAFKHGTSKQLAQSWITMNIKMESSEMSYKLVNSIESDNNSDHVKIGGLGLQNVKRRLELLYKDNYKFETKMLNDRFSVDLEITLEELEERYNGVETGIQKIAEVIIP